MKVIIQTEQEEITKVWTIKAFLKEVNSYTDSYTEGLNFTNTDEAIDYWVDVVNADEGVAIDIMDVTTSLDDEV